MLTVDGQRAAYLALHDLAHEVAGGRWVATGGGGYALVDVVPRAWTHLLGDRRRARRSTRRPTTPEAWRDARRASALGRTAPVRMTDGRDPGVPRLVARATTPRPGWTGRSRRPGRRSSRCTASTRCP